MDNFSSHSADRLVEERKRLGLTQQEAAAAGGVSREIWGRYERGAAVPGGSVLAGFASAGADAQYILTGRRSTVAAVDLALLRICLEGVEEGLAQARRKMAEAAKAELVVQLYDLHRTAESPPQKATILQFIKRAA